MLDRRDSDQDIDFAKMGGLAPAIVQDSASRQVLMLGFVNAEALRATRQSGYMTFWSRSRQRLWQKGEESGHRLKVDDIVVDCDRDSLLILATPEGPTCHRGVTSCFDITPGIGQLGRLWRRIGQRAADGDEKSYTFSLLGGGVDRCAQKLGEEAVELVIAAKNDDDRQVMAESADLLYHFLVLLKRRGIALDAVMETLAARDKP